MTDRNALLINQETGELDWAWIKRLAMARAQAEYGNSNPPVRYVRNSLRLLQDRASAMRTAWRRDHGLPDDSAYTTLCSGPAWGASGDSFGKGF